MNAGEEVLDFLYSTQLQVDDEWAVRTPNGFVWWAADNAQTVEILREQTLPDGKMGYLVGVRTEMVADVELTDAALAELNETVMQYASMSGPVYDPETGTVSLCSVVRVHDESPQALGMQLSTAAILQLAEVAIFGEQLAEVSGGRLAVSGHPERGAREQPDEMAYAAARIFSADNREPLRLQEKDFHDAVEQHMMQPPSVGASAGDLGLTVEFPYGDASSLCQFFGDQDHPLYGNGLLIGQSFPYRVATEAEGIRLALELNRADLTEYPAGDGFGSYLYRDGMVCFNAFIPNLLLRDGILTWEFHSCAARAFSMSVRLLGEEWNDDSFSLDHSAIARAMRQENPNPERN